MDNKKIGLFISSLRKEKKMTQLVLAEKLFVSDKAVSKWERGLSLPDVGLLEDLAKLLGVSVSEILKGEKLEEITKESSDEIIKDGILFFQKKYFREKMLFVGTFIATIVVILFIFGIIDCYLASNSRSPLFTYYKINVKTYEDNSITEIDSTYFGVGYTVTKCEKTDETSYYIFQIGRNSNHICFIGSINDNN